MSTIEEVIVVMSSGTGSFKRSPIGCPSKASSDYVQ